MQEPTTDRRRWLAAALGLLVAGPAFSRAEAGVLLAREAPLGIDPAGYLVSEKYDGVRALWDGRQLRFRSGAPVQAPAWFLAALPPQALDGELWMGRRRFEALSGAVRREQPADDEWRQIRYMVFELPGAPGPFEQRAARIAALSASAPSAPWQAVAQWRLVGREALAQRLAEVVGSGGEGLALHRADAGYVTGRSDVLLKLKPFQDAEALVIGHVAGEGRHAGRLGALRVKTPEGQVFLIGTGFTDAQRDRPPAIGSTVTYRFRGLTDRGLPRFASFMRVRDEA